MADVVLAMWDSLVPCFPHAGQKKLSGPHCARYLLESDGKKIRGFKPNWMMPTSPRQMVRILTASEGLRACVRRQSRESSLVWLREQVRNKHRPVALFVRSHIFAPFPTRWIVVCGLRDEDFLIYDNRVGDSAKSSTLPAGNAIWSEAKLLALWVVPLRRKVTAVKILKPEESLPQEQPLARQAPKNPLARQTTKESFDQWQTSFFKKSAFTLVRSND